jgi:hypothetical protein
MSAPNIELHNATFEHHSGNDGYTFIDPITSEVLKPGEVPSGILADERMQQGFTFLREHADEIHGKVILGRHGDTADLAGYDLVSDVRQHGNLLFVEGIGWQEGDQEGFNRATQATEDDDNVTVTQRLAGFVTQDDYLREKWAQLFGSGVDVRFADIADTPQPLDDIMLNWNDTWETLHDSAVTTEDHRRSAAIAAVGFNNYREWYMCGLLGEQLAQYSETSSDSSLGFVYLVGTTHQGVVDKLASLGVSVETTQPTGELPEGNRRLGQAIASLSVSGSDLERIYS